MGRTTAAHSHLDEAALMPGAMRPGRWIVDTQAVDDLWITLAGTNISYDYQAEHNRSEHDVGQRYLATATDRDQNG